MLEALLAVKGISAYLRRDPTKLEKLLLSRAERRSNGCLIIRGYGLHREVYQKVAGNAWAHRIAYALWVGPVSPGLDVHHKCAHRDCIEPSHLEQITHRENCRIGLDPHKCHNGHDRQEDPATGRYKACAACNRIAVIEYEARKRRHRA